MSKRYILCNLLLLLALSMPRLCMAQVSIDLDFEGGSFASNHAPASFPGWSIMRKPAFEVNVDTVNPQSGKRCISIASNSSKPDRSESITFLNSEPLSLKPFAEAKQIVISGFIRIDSLSADGSAAIWANIRGGTKQPDYTRSVSNEIKLGEWEAVTIKLPIDSGRTSVIWGGFLQGAGKVSFDNFKVMLDGEPVKNEMDFRLAEKTGINPVPLLNSFDLKKAGRQVTPLGRSLPGISDKNLDRLFGNRLDKVQVIALGEASHGTSEFFVFKHRVIEYLAGKKQYDLIIAFENSVVSTMKLNDYVLKGEGDPKRILQDNFYSVWRTGEVLDFVEWVRLHNSSKRNKIIFSGIDMQSSIDVLQSLSDLVKAEEQFSAAVKDLMVLNDALMKSRNSQTLLASMKSKVKLLQKDIHSHNAHSFTTSSDFSLIKQHVQLLDQFIGYRERSLMSENNFRVIFRDSSMAENVSWLVHSFPAKKVVVWGHNGHISKNESSMGGHIAKKFGSSYVNVGLTTSFGGYTSYDHRGISKRSDLQKPDEYTYEYWLDKIRSDNWGSSTTKLQKVFSPGESYKGRLKLRALGFSEQKYQFMDISLLDEYDYIVYLPYTSPSRSF